MSTFPNDIWNFLNTVVNECDTSKDVGDLSRCVLARKKREKMDEMKKRIKYLEFVFLIVPFYLIYLYIVLYGLPRSIFSHPTEF